MDKFKANGPQIVVDVTDFSKVNYEVVMKEIEKWKEEIINGQSTCSP